MDLLLELKAKLVVTQIAHTVVAPSTATRKPTVRVTIEGATKVAAAIVRATILESKTGAMMAKAKA